jgi:hypothetical protein
MPQPPRRKRFQIHLSTAVVLMFVAGGIIWANARAGFVRPLSLPIPPASLHSRDCRLTPRPLMLK